MSVLSVSHQKNRFQFGVQFSIGHHHGEFASGVGQGADAADHDLGSGAGDKIHGQSLKRLDFHVAHVGSDLFGQVDSLLGFEQSTLVAVDSNPHDQAVRNPAGPLYDVEVTQSYWVKRPCVCLLYTSPSPRDRG